MSDHPSVPVRVSVIIAAFNAAQYLHVAVRSVLRQTEQNFEVLIIDDCSRDDTWKIAQDFQKNDSRLRAYRMKKNGGQYAATNFALGLAHGEWAAILDADDWYDPSRLKTMIDKAQNANVSIVADNFYFFDNAAGAISGVGFSEVDA